MVCYQTLQGLCCECRKWRNNDPDVESVLHPLEWRPRLFAAPFAATGALHRGTQTAQHNLFERLKVSRTVWEAREKGAGDTELTNELKACAIAIRVSTPHLCLPDIAPAGTSKPNVRNAMPSVRF